MPLFRTMSPKGSVNARKSNGPSTDPCGTPQDKGTFFHFSSLTLSIWKRLSRYETNYFKASPWIPDLLESLSCKTEWLTVSNATVSLYPSPLVSCFELSAMLFLYYVLLYMPIAVVQKDHFLPCVERIDLKTRESTFKDSQGGYKFCFLSRLFQSLTPRWQSAFWPLYWETTFARSKHLDSYI